jgi:serine/threonine-protein kinase
VALVAAIGNSRPLRRGWLIAAAAVGLVAAAVGVTWLLLDGGRPEVAPIPVQAPPAGTAVAAAPTVAPPAAPAVEPVVVPGAAGAVGLDAGAPSAATRTGKEPQVVKAASVSTQKRRPLPATLTVADIERVVARGQSRYAACFESHKDELPAEKGELQVRISIPSSGKARAQVQGELVASKVGGCVVAAVQRLRFPAHGDQELQVLFPLSWRVTR